MAFAYLLLTSALPVVKVCLLAFVGAALAHVVSLRFRAHSMKLTDNLQRLIWSYVERREGLLVFVNRSKAMDRTSLMLLVLHVRSL